MCSMSARSVASSRVPDPVPLGSSTRSSAGIGIPSAGPPDHARRERAGGRVDESWQIDDNENHRQGPTTGRYSLLKQSDAWQGRRREGEGIHQDNTPMPPRPERSPADAGPGSTVRENGSGRSSLPPKARGAAQCGMGRDDREEEASGGVAAGVEVGLPGE